MVKVKVINKGRQPLPAYATPQSAGMDLRANIDNPVTLRPLERKLVPTGLYMALPEGYEAQIRPRSGLALREGLSMANTPGLVDSHYRGELKVIAVNLDAKKTIHIERGERIAQLVIQAVPAVSLLEVDELDETDRGEGGFGSSGTA